MSPPLGNQISAAILHSGINIKSLLFTDVCCKSCHCVSIRLHSYSLFLPSSLHSTKFQRKLSILQKYQSFPGSMTHSITTVNGEKGRWLPSHLSLCLFWFSEGWCRLRGGIATNLILITYDWLLSAQWWYAARGWSNTWISHSFTKDLSHLFPFSHRNFLSRDIWDCSEHYSNACMLVSQINTQQ